MEWVGRRVRQRPGPQNALGQVKFIFPTLILFLCMIRHQKFDREQRPLVMVVFG
jgi:hypothetical protein